MVKRKRKPGGGRKKKEPTKVVRIPIGIEKMVDDAKLAYQRKQAEIIIGTIHPMP